ncbi:MAG: Hsp20/alpha crystallin family protein [Fastidiosipilaceae bacterium]|jgi:HSP20 family protein
MFDLVPFGRNNRNWVSPFDQYLQQMNSLIKNSLPESMCTDIVDKGDHFELTAELPGFDKSDVKLSLQNDYLTITATHSEESEKKNDDAKYTSRERRFCNYRRSFDVSGVETDQIKAEYKNGVLEVLLPKKQAQPREDDGAVEIEIE